MIKEKRYKPETTGDGIIVTWVITTTCQERCAYCISEDFPAELTTEAGHFAVQKRLIDGGLTKMRYIGGEPLRVPHLPALIADAHESGVNTRLSTNGILLSPQTLDQIAPHLDSVALPFESLDDEVNRGIRGTARHRQIVTEKIEMIKHKGNIGLLINTCAHRENLHLLPELGGRLNELGIDHWKIRQFYSGSGRGAAVNADRFRITDEEFHATVASLKQMYPDLKIDGRMPSKLSTRLMVSPRADLHRMLADEGGDTYLYGNLLTDNLNIGEIYRRDHCD